ncbi:MAG: 50S ribosomal protein L29 [Candidatus Marithrix sp.]|nr:50S ribosomal protein L29 [Candidatus Marithrix sp.]
MRATELRAKSISELNKELLELLREHFSLRVQRVNGQLSRHTRIRGVRRNIARVKTVINEKKAT